MTVVELPAREPRPHGPVVMNDLSNLGQCVRCAWVGPPLHEDPTWCPHCNHADLYGPDVMPPPADRVRAALKVVKRPKVARNAPCPCGSGVKAKRCCHA